MIARLIIIIFAYFVAGRLGLAIPYVGSLITLFWLPTGIAVAAMSRWGWRYWPSVYIGAFLVNLSISSSYSLSLGIAVGNTLAPLLVAWLLSITRFSSEFDQPKDIPLFCLAIFIGMLVSAFGGVSMLWLSGMMAGDAIPSAFQAWWLGDSVGVLLAAPFLLTVTSKSLREFKQRHIELIAWSILTGLLGWGVFFSKTGNTALPLAFLPLPLAVWAALRFGVTGASLSMIVLSFLAAWSTSLGRGPFSQFETHQALFLLWAYMGTLVLSGLMITALLVARKKAEQLLQESQSRFASIVGSAMDAIITIDSRQIITFVNNSAERIFGYKAQNIVGHPISIIIPSRFHSNHKVHVDAFGKTGISARSMSHLGKIYGLRASGEEFPIEASISQVKIENEINYSVILRDITERIASESKIRFLTQIYAALSHTNQALIESADDKTLFNKICEIAVEFGSLKLAWIGTCEEPDGLIRPVAIYGSNKDYLEQVVISSRGDVQEGHGPTGTAFREGLPIFIQDFKTNPMIDHWRKQIANFGWGSLGAVPIIRGRSSYAVLTFYHTDAYIFSPEIIDLLKEMGRNIGSALDRFDLEEAKRKSQESMKLAAAIYRSSSEAIMVTDENNLISDVNPAFTTLTGYTLGDVIGKNPNLLKSGRHDKEFYQKMWHSILTTDHWQGELWDRRKDGELHAKLTNISIIRHPDGSIYRHVAQFLDITDKKQNEELIWKQANFDSLTNLPNRHMFHDRLEQEIKKARRMKLSLALLFIDLDRFKEINDTLGHAKGDLLLVEAANRISKIVRSTDTVARLGGDEFTVVLPEFGERFHIERIAQDLIKALEFPFQLGESDVGYISASIGITIFPDDAEDIDGLMKHADQAMYVAKSEGRNRFGYFTESMQAEAQDKLLLTNDLRQALARDELHVFYQPIIEIESGLITKAEALLRWKHPTRGMVSPAIFIPLAEESGLINEIGEWVFNQAIADITEWYKRCGCLIQVSVNKSPVQFENSEKHLWPEILKASGLPKNVITVEITEGILVKESSKAKQRLLDFRNNGIEVSIDDFGTGFSSLSYLKKFDIDYLKIDRSFVMDLERDKDDKSLVEAIIVMAHKLEIRAIAEGVETEGQRDLLKSFGCDFIQGYLYSPAITASEFEKMIARHS